MKQPKKIHVQYYAALREKRGISEETVATLSANAKELYLELKDRFGFSLDRKVIKVAVNDEFKDWDTELENGDTVIFIPPVAGG